MNKIYALYEIYKIPYILSYYDVDDLSPFRGLYLIVVKWENILENGFFGNPRFKVYSPIIGEASKDYNFFRSPATPRDSFITHVDVGDTKKKSLTELLSHYKNSFTIKVMLIQILKLDDDNVMTCEFSSHFNDNVQKAFIIFVEKNSLGKRNRRIIIRRPQSISPADRDKIHQKLDPEVSVKQKEMDALKAVFECPKNPDLHTQLVENLHFLCNIIEIFRTLPPVVRPTLESVQSPNKLLYIGLKKFDYPLKTRAKQYLDQILPDILLLVEHYLKKINLEKPLFNETTRITITSRLNDVLKKTKIYSAEIKKELPSSILKIPYSVIEILSTEKFPKQPLSIYGIKIFLGESLLEALSKQAIARAV